MSFLHVYIHTAQVTILPQEHQSVCRGESISYNCIANGSSSMVLFSPPIVNESNALALFSNDPVPTCNPLSDSAAAIILVDTTRSSVFMGTFTLYISEEQSEGQLVVFCRAFSADGMATTNETTFSVIGMHMHSLSTDIITIMCICISVSSRS